MRLAEVLASILLVVPAACDAPLPHPPPPMVSSSVTASSPIVPASTGSAATTIAPTSTPREEIARDVVSATAMRLDKPGAGWSASAPAAPGKLAGFTVRARSERALDAPTLAELLERLRSRDGYDDKTMKRCAMEHLVGFRLTTTRGEVVEIALDFNCQKLFGVYGAARAVHGTHFDPSRAALLALVKRALPGDAEVGKLQ